MRYEIKMTCAEEYLADVRSWVRLHPDGFTETYPPRRVNSLYFDTYEADCLMDNLIGISQRKKLRFRWYGDDTAAVQGVLELKCKSSQLGWKKHCPIGDIFDLGKVSWSEFVRRLQRQVDDGEFALWLSHLSCPVLITSYMREYYESTDHQVRVTIDHDLAFYEQVTHWMPNLHSKAPVPERVVVEVKSDGSLSHRVSDVLTLFPLQVERNSKYVGGTLGALCFVL